MANTVAPSAPLTNPVIGQLTATKIDRYLGKQGSPLQGHGSTFVSAGAKYNVDPVLLVAITGAETNFGKYGPSQSIHNPFGLGPGISYANWDDAIIHAAQTIAGYHAGSIADVQKHWAPVGAGNDPKGLNTHWLDNVTKFVNDFNNYDQSQGPIGSVLKSPYYAAKGVVSGFSSVLDVLKVIFSIRGAYFLGGSVAGILGIIILAKSLTETVREEVM